MSAEVVGQISRISYRPVKAMGATEVETALITPGGMIGDKEYAVVERTPDENGVHNWVSQREFPILAAVRAELTDDTLHLDWPGGDTIQVPRNLRGKQIPSRVWTDTIEDSVEQGDEVSDWLSDHLDHGVLLVRAGDTFDRPVSTKWLPNSARLRGFQDSYPIHWFYQESLDELNRRIVEDGGEPIPWTRFRPNIVAKGAPEPDYEHLVFNGYFGEIPFQNAKPCDRCQVPTIDQDLGQRINTQPNTALNGYKRWLKLPDNKVKVIFGENAIPQAEGEVSVGQEITVVDFRVVPLVYGGAEIKPLPKPTTEPITLI